MRHSAIQLLMLGTCAMAVAAVATEGEASGRHIRKHQHTTNLGLRDPFLRHSRGDGEVRAIAPPPRTAAACPGNARGFDCKIWPPPIADDPDRKSGDGGP